MSSYSFPVSISDPVIFHEPFSTLPPCTVRAKPGASGTLLIEYQIVKIGDWTAWPPGTVTTVTVYVLAGAVYALRFTATTTDGLVEIAQ